MAVRLDHGDDDLAEVHEINVTPFIDVILVLLIVFMIAAPLATVDVPVDLPSANAEQQPRPTEPLYLSVKSDMSLLIGEEPVTEEGLRAALEEKTGGDREQRIFLRADKTVDYGDLMNVMNSLRSAGYLKIALVSLESPSAP
ncbi:TonB system transport protein ExbD [Parvibaculum sp.]|jgi:biopolymer transport protein ExbD|uniref:TonB system transport protein ExbD n=1 Tax=Parvibaculum sp. TaxID=2024848 RepID=UPI000C42C860|nr:TonB system transport protein ExbD [Parvibaculum sp.]MAU61765.1 TonB system transport protein ExbD [Parvibaculum sp.]MBO6666648.1 TonB system transport protein ExbD [Parvibaculum sp.]MBO6691551.1 TonB system transport protein ExbD [Parvibaculum sp.]MBO6713269.1 TonB system transport protein ExbD [Parvibaculum sp.]|tara:strand:- start:4066 stop:4491 length:426 start_codon:yes stop_codon:yes gene_type:complete